MRELKINKQVGRDTPLSTTSEPEYSPQYMAQRENDNRILRDKLKSDESRKAEIVKQSKDNEAEKEKAYKQQRDNQSSDAAKDAQKSQSSAGAQKTNLSSLLNRR